METNGVEQMEPKDAAALVESGSAVLLDVREPHEWAAGHAPDAIHVPLGQLTVDSIPADKTVVVMCHAGHRSQAAAEALVEAGLDARNISGGIMAWNEADLPTVANEA